MKTSKATPKPIVNLDTTINHLHTLQVMMKRQLRLVNALSKKIPEMRHKADMEGVPRSNEEFNTPLYEIKTLAEAMEKCGGHIRYHVNDLLATEPENWHLK